MPGLYDLNVPWSASQNPLELQRIISFLSELGYDTLALNHTMAGPPPSPLTNPISKDLPFKLPPKTVVLRRCTIEISDPAQNHRLPQLVPLYDILAIRPTTEKAYLAACVSLPPDQFGIISLDLTQRFSFFFRPKQVLAAIARGLKFEICYSEALLKGDGARRNFIGNVLQLVRATSGRGLVLSSGGSGNGNVLGCRGPADVLNLMDVWGLKRDRRIETTNINPRSVVVNEGIKRSSFRGVVDVIYGGQQPLRKEKGEKDAKGKEVVMGQGKRKAGPDLNEDGTPKPSKRALKRAKAEAKKALQEENSADAPPSTSTLFETDLGGQNPMSNASTAAELISTIVSNKKGKNKFQNKAGG